MGKRGEPTIKPSEAFMPTTRTEHRVKTTHHRNGLQNYPNKTLAKRFGISICIFVSLSNFSFSKMSFSKCGLCNFTIGNMSFSKFSFCNYHFSNVSFCKFSVNNFSFTNVSFARLALANVDLSSVACPKLKVATLALASVALAHFPSQLCCEGSV